MLEKKVAKVNIIRKWKAMFPWLDFVDGMKMVSKSCKSQEEKLQLMPGANLTFMTGSTNYHPSTLKDHAQTVTNDQLEKRYTQKQKHQAL